MTILERLSFQRVENDDGTYVASVRVPATRANPGGTITVHGIKGEIVGDRRLDRMTITFIADDGHVEQMAEREVAVLVNLPDDRILTDEQVREAFVREWLVRKLQS